LLFACDKQIAGHTPNLVNATCCDALLEFLNESILHCKRYAQTVNDKQQQPRNLRKTIYNPFCLNNSKVML